MDRLYAICPHCEKSIFVAENADGNGVCSACGQALHFPTLRQNGWLIDAESADSEYEAARQYFMNNDFKEAGVHYQKTLTYNRNHYLAEYYAALCDVYENEDRADYDMAGVLTGALVRSVRKMGLCQINVQGRIDFLGAVLNQAYILLSSYFNRIYENYEKTELWDILRDKCLLLAVAVRELTNVEKEALMVFDGSIAKSLVGLADLAICACRKVVQSHLVGDAKLDLPTDHAYEKAKACYDVLLYYASSLDPTYSVSGYKPDYTGNLLYNQSVLSVWNRYNSENKSAGKKYLSTPGELLDGFRKSAMVAVQFSHHTCFKSLATDKGEQARIALINDAISFCFELLMPRIHINAEKKVVIDVKTYAQACDVGAYLADFMQDFIAYNHRLAGEYAHRFFVKLSETVKLYYGAVFNSYNRIVDRLKEAQNSEYRYYKNFLHEVIYSCVPALREIVPVAAGAASDRLKILKFGKQVIDEFLMLNDYKVEELALSAKYSDVLDIYNAFDNSLASIGKRG